MAVQTKFAPTGKIPPWAIVEKNRAEISWGGAPLFCRANGKTGLFSVAGKDSGPKIFMHLLDHRWSHQARWGGTTENWLDILFLDSDRTVSIMPLRSNAASRMAGWLSGLQSNPLCDYLPHAIWISLEMLPNPVIVDGVEESIYLPEVVQFDWMGADEFQAAAAWLALNQPSENDDCWIMPGALT
jgi:hypothetical protein